MKIIAIAEHLVGRVRGICSFTERRFAVAAQPRV